MIRRLLRKAASTDLAFAHDLPEGRPRDREDFILDRCAGKRVIHLGCVDEHLLDAKLRRGRWLHERLADVASELVGIDLDAAGVEAVRALGYDAYVADAQDETQLRALALDPADIVVAGEVIEHLESPGRFLSAVRQLAKPGGTVIVTTPNASALTNLITPLFRLELVHPDHMVTFSPQTLKAILERSGWLEPEISFYHRPPRPDLARGVAGKTLAFARRVVALLVRVVPGWSDGLIAVASNPETGRQREEE